MLRYRQTLTSEFHLHIQPLPVEGLQAFYYSEETMHIPREHEYNSVHMSLYSFTYIQACWDIPSLLGNISRPDRWVWPYSVFLLFQFHILNNFPTKNGPFCDCATEDLGCCLTNHFKTRTNHERRTVSTESMRSFTCGSVWIFDVSLWHTYEPTCQRAAYNILKWPLK